MPKYIDADATIRIAAESANIVWKDDEDTRFLVTEAIKRAVNAMPAAPVRQEVHAAWIYKAVDGEVRIACTKCGYKKPYSESLHKFDYCPACGSTMDLDAKGE